MFENFSIGVTRLARVQRELVEERIAELHDAIWRDLVKAETLIQRLCGVHRRQRPKAERVVVSPASFLDHTLYEPARHSVTAVRRLDVHALDFANRRTQCLERQASDR